MLVVSLRLRLICTSNLFFLHLDMSSCFTYFGIVESSWNSKIYYFTWICLEIFSIGAIFKLNQLTESLLTYWWTGDEVINVAGRFVMSKSFIWNFRFTWQRLDSERKQWPFNSDRFMTDDIVMSKSLFNVSIFSIEIFHQEI